MIEIPTYDKKIPRLTTEQMIEVDRLMIEKYGILLIQMMENAGRCLAQLALTEFVTKNNKIAVLAGTGGNGGGALVCARRLANWGFKVDVYLTNQESFTGIPGHQFDILRSMQVNINDEIPKKTYDLIIDGLIGYGIKGNPYKKSKELINWANGTTSPVLSLDTPSGIDLTTGQVFDPVIKADATLTLALPKKGLYHEDVIQNRGKLYLGDISVPPRLYTEPSLSLKVENDIFQKFDVVRID